MDILSCCLEEILTVSLYGESFDANLRGIFGISICIQIDYSF